jgi:hypothetical protein
VIVFAVLVTLGIAAVTVLGFRVMRAAAGDEMIARLNRTEGDG